MEPNIGIGVLAGAAALVSFGVVIWLFGPKRMTRTVSGFSAWMLFTTSAFFSMRALMAPDAPLLLVIGGSIITGLLSYAVNYQIDDRRMG